MATFTQPVDAKPDQPQSSSLAEMPAPGRVATSAVNQYSMIGKSIKIKGEIVASDPVYVYGSVEGSISAPEHRVTVGKDGRVKADISAREVVIMGEVCGNLEASERAEIRCDGSLLGNMSTRRIYVEEGAVMSGVIDVHKPSKKEKAETRPEQQQPETDRGSLVSFPEPELAAEIAS